MEKGDKRYIDEGLVKNQNRLLWQAINLTHSVDDAWELLQETALVALMQTEKYCEDGKFVSWAGKLMYNRFLNNETAECKKATKCYDEFPHDTSSHPTMDTESDYRCKEIYDLITALPPGQANTFLLYIDGYSYAEIAKRQKTTINCVRNNIHAARVTLRHILAKEQ